MNISYTITDRYTSGPNPGDIYGEMTSKTLYAFSNKPEAMFALGATGVMLQREFSVNDIFTPGFRGPAISRDNALDLHKAVKQRYLGLDISSAIGGANPFLTAEQSNFLWSVTDWATENLQREVAIDSNDGFSSVIAGSLVLRQSMRDIEHSAEIAAHVLLWARRSRGLRRRRSPQLPTSVIKYAVTSDGDFPDPDSRRIVTVVAANL